MNACFYYIAQKMMDLWATQAYQFLFEDGTEHVTKSQIKKKFIQWDSFGQIKNEKTIN